MTPPIVELAKRKPVPLASFFRGQIELTEDEFLELWTGAFLLGRSRSVPPTLLAVPRETGRVISLGADATCDFAYPKDATLAQRHLEVEFHKGFDGWVLRDLKTESGTMIQGERVSPDRAHILEDRGTVTAGQADTHLQLYLPETLFERMGGAGVTARLGQIAATEDTLRVPAVPRAKPKPEPEVRAVAAKPAEPAELPDETQVLAWLCGKDQPSLPLRPGTAVTIGRAASCVLCLQHDAVSRRHGLVRATREGQLIYTDRSSNGTLINGALVKPQQDTRIKIGDRLEFGPVKLVLRSPEDPRIKASGSSA